MELQNPQFIEIITTLEMIDRANKAIVFHKQLPNPDTMAIGQYLHLRADYMQQLSKLLQNFEIEIHQPEAYNIPLTLLQNVSFNRYSNAPI